MTPRANIRLSTKLASALCHMLRDDGTGKFVPIITREQAKRMTEKEVLAVFDWDHDPIPKAHGGEDVHHNLTPRPKPEHREKTAKRDIPMISKVKRLTKAQEETRRRILARAPGEKRKPSGKIKSRSTWGKRRFGQ